jgi:AcrR family transcriptional regulator
VAAQDNAREKPSDSFIRSARRTQLVNCAIDVIAELGYERASTVRIAQRADVSRGVLTYHFSDRAELIDSVINAVYELAVAELGPLVTAALSPREALLTFVGGSIDFYAAYPRHIAALGEIFAADRHTSTPTRDQRHEHTREMTDVRAILTNGQNAGQFRTFDVDVMAATIRAGLDVAARHFTAGGSIEPLRSELVATFDAATRATSRRRSNPT